MVVTAETILFQLGLLKNINLYYNSKAYCIEHSNNLSAISESVTEYIQNSLDSRMIVFSGIIVHDCVREEFILLEDGTVRSILYVGVKLSPGLSPWIPSPGLSQWISTLVRSPDQFEVMVHTYLWYSF